MKFLLLTLLLASPVESRATTAFEQTAGGPAVDRGIFVSVVENDGYVAIGTTQSFGEGKEDIYLVRTDEAGEVQWTQTFGGADEELGWSVHPIEDGFILAGSTMSFGEGENDFYLLKTNTEGELEWSKTYGGEGNDRCWALLPTADGGFLLAGETTSYGEGEQDVYLVKTDTQGTMLWSRHFGGAKSDRTFAVAQADDGGFVLAGQTYSEGAGDRDAQVIKTSAEGELEWSITHGGEASDVAHGVVRSGDGAFFVTGYTTSFAPNGDDPYLLKIDAEGKTLWTRVLPLEGINHTITGDLATDGGFYLVGFTDYWGQGKRALLVKTDVDGQLEWHRNIQHSAVGETSGYTVRATDDGGCVFAGHATTKVPRNLDLLLVHVTGEDH